MPRTVSFELITFVMVTLGLVASPVCATVETVTVSPLVLAVGQPIMFSGVDVETISPNNPQNVVMLRIYQGYGCSYTPSNAIAFTSTSLNLNGPYTGVFNTTLSFPAVVAAPNQSYSADWAVTSQSYQNGLPAGSYSVSVTDIEASTNGSPGVCKNFTIANSSAVSEFADPLVAACTALSLVSLLLLRRSWLQIRGSSRHP